MMGHNKGHIRPNNKGKHSQFRLSARCEGENGFEGRRQPCQVDHFGKDCVVDRWHQKADGPTANPVDRLGRTVANVTNLFHGKIKALADAAREGGLKF